MKFYGFSERLDNACFDSSPPHVEFSNVKTELELVGQEGLLWVVINPFEIRFSA